MLHYIPLAIPCIAAFLAYLYGKMSNNLNRFDKQVEMNLNEICGPIFFELRAINSCVMPEEKAEKVKRFFADFNSTKIKLHKLGNRVLIEDFIELEQEYFSKVVFNISKLKDLEKKFETEYWTNFNSLYSEYKWNQRISYGNYILRSIYSVIKKVKEFIEFTFIVIACGVYLLCYEWFTNKYFLSPNFLPDNFVETIVLLFLIIGLIYISIIGIYPKNVSQKTKHKKRNKFLKKFK